MTIVSIPLMVIALVLAFGIVLAVRNARNSEDASRVRRTPGDSPPEGVTAARTAGMLGSELFSLDLRIEAVKEASRQAVASAELVGSLWQPQVAELAEKLRAGCERQRLKVLEIAPLTGRTREHALARVMPGIASLEDAAQELQALADRAVEGAGPAGIPSQAEEVERQAVVLAAAIDELGL